MKDLRMETLYRKQILAAIKNGIELSQEYAHGQAVEMGWWNDLETGEKIEKSPGDQLMLIVTEIAEGYEGVRKNKMDDHLPKRKMIEVELADAAIRIFDTAGSMKLDLAGAIAEKLEYNRTRKDHQISERKKPNGKKF